MLRIFCSFILLISFISLDIQAVTSKENKLFSITLKKSENPSNLLEYNRNNGIRSVVAGPIVLSEDKFLFYSDNGYLLYNREGTLVDSHSVYSENKGLAENDSSRLKLAFPTDLSTIIYYKKVSDPENPIKIFFKKIGKGRLKELKDNLGNIPAEIQNSELQNILSNSITDEMASTFMKQRYLAGYRGDTRMWTLDSYYSSTSPLIITNKESFEGFYPGVRMGKSKNHQLMVNPLQAFNKDGKWFYSGIHSNVGANDSISYQKIFIYDEAGNSLWSDSLLKQENENAIIGEDSQTYYTAKKIRKYVFIPSMDSSGNIYYGVYDFKKGNVDIFEKEYFNISSKKSDAQLTDLIKKEQQIEMEAVEIPCGRETPGKQIASVTLLDEKGRRVTAQTRHLEKDGYIARISRVQYRDLYRKLARKRTDIPMFVSLFMDSLSESFDAGCPYLVALSGPRGMIRAFDYPFGARIASARVLNVQKNDEIVLRVDCMNYAEILILKSSGQFVDRFVFNRQDFKDRKDIVAADKEGKLIELDFEASPESGQYISWER